MCSSECSCSLTFEHKPIGKAIHKPIGKATIWKAQTSKPQENTSGPPTLHIHRHRLSRTSPPPRLSARRDTWGSGACCKSAPRQWPVTERDVSGSNLPSLRSKREAIHASPVGLLTQKDPPKTTTAGLNWSFQS